MRELESIKEEGDIDRHEWSKEIEDMMERYKSYTDQTENGENGKTPQFWMTYTKVHHLYHELDRAIRVGNLEDFTACLYEVSTYCFAFNKVNYSRWILRYHNNLLQIKETHPEVYEEFKKGWFAIQQTKKPFSKGDIDLRLEQTINADAASQRTGISAMTNSICARQRWAESQFMRVSVMSSLLEEYGMTRKEDISAHLQSHTITSDNKHLTKVMEQVKETQDPFDTSLDPTRLYNIGNGKAVNYEVEDFLLNIKSIGEEAREKFLLSCIEDPKRFEEKIPQVKIRTFASLPEKQKVVTKDGKEAVCLMRDMFGTLLFLSMERDVAMEEVLKYPLAKVPLSLSHADGSKLSTPKSKLTTTLEISAIEGSPESIDVTIVDASFYLHLLTNVPDTYGKIAEKIMIQLMRIKSPEIHFVWDKWLQPSIKDTERCTRGDTQATYQVTGTLQRRTQDWMKLLRSSSFKTSLNKFLLEAWSSCKFKEIIGDKILYTNEGDHCYIFYTDQEKVVKEKVPELNCNHQEADNRMFYHLCNLLRLEDVKNVVIRTSDTDCLVIGLANLQYSLEAGIEVWLEVGTASKNTIRYINLNSIFANIGASVCAALPGFHAFTGCDYTASFSRKGKVRPLKLLMSDLKAQKASKAISAEGPITQETITAINKFTCKMYGNKKISDVDELRFDVFARKYNLKIDKNLAAVKKLEASALPPCKKVLLQKIKRTHFIATMWMSASRLALIYDADIQI